ncbi:MAG: DUF5856 family protein [Nanoarchaeota archaeon]
MDIVSNLSLGKREGENSLIDKSFFFLIKLMGYRNQLRMNHWQTLSYAEHKMTDKLIDALTKYTDSIGEVVLGTLGRPQISTISTNISDIKIVSTNNILERLDIDVKEMLAEYKITEYESVIALLGELDATVKKFKYLSTLE